MKLCPYTHTFCKFSCPIACSIIRLGAIELARSMEGISDAEKERVVDFIENGIPEIEYRDLDTVRKMLLISKVWTLESANAELRSAVAYGHPIQIDDYNYLPNEDGSRWERRKIV